MSDGIYDQFMKKSVGGGA